MSGMTLFNCLVRVKRLVHDAIDDASIVTGAIPKSE